MSKYNVYVDGVSVEAVFNKLGGVEGAKRFLAGNVKMVIKDHIVNGKKPFIPDRWKVESHKEMVDFKLTREGDDLFLDGKRIEFFLHDLQRAERTVVGNDLRKALEGRPVLNACVLDYLREHPELIPESWKTDEKGRTRYIFFWGTIYRGFGVDLYVRCLDWDGDRWRWDDKWLVGEWEVSDPAAIIAS